ncbi:MAG: universal stress protein [Candidatus Acidiferrales bacterium]
MKTLETRTRIEIKNILFPTDFSSAGDAAIPFAMELAKRFGAKICALHVRPPVINPMTNPAGWDVLESAAKGEVEQQKNQLLGSFKGIHPEIMIVEGDFWQNLQTALATHHTDLIVLGTRGRSGAEKFLLGSKAEEILRRAPCAVLTVGPHSHVPPPRTGEFTEILFATDFGPESATAATYAMSLAQEFQAHLTLLHVIPEEKPGDLILPGEQMESSERRLHELVPAEAALWCVPQFAVEEGPVAEKILEVAKQRNADLIVLGVHRPRRFPGAATHLPIATAHKVVTHATSPVLTVRG